LNRHFNRLEIDLGAVAHNLGQVKRIVGSGVKVMAVVKADAYGHGLIPVSRRLAESGADAFGVMDLDEGVRLREAGLKQPVFILAGFDTDGCPEIVRHRLAPFVYDPGLARELNEAARKADARVEVHLKLDTGMNRLGVRCEEAERFLEAVRRLDRLDVTGLATHFADADLKDGRFMDGQLDRFDDLTGVARRMGYDRLRLNNAANSAAVLGSPRSHLDMVRPGLMLYGDLPGEHLAGRAQLRPAMRMSSRIIQIKRLSRGEAVSYGLTWTAFRETRLAVVPVGYTHGFHWLLSNRGQALIRGSVAPVRGRVCMNLTMFDVTDVPDAAPGDEVVLLGAQAGASITAGQVAARAGTISYEMFCTMGGLNSREYAS